MMQLSDFTVATEVKDYLYLNIRAFFTLLVVAMESCRSLGVKF
jgi:hypothetical protein